MYSKVPKTLKFSIIKCMENRSIARLFQCVQILRQVFRIGIKQLMFITSARKMFRPKLEPGFLGLPWLCSKYWVMQMLCGWHNSLFFIGHGSEIPFVIFNREFSILKNIEAEIIIIAFQSMGFSRQNNSDKFITNFIAENQHCLIQFYLFFRTWMREFWGLKLRRSWRKNNPFSF